MHKDHPGSGQCKWFSNAKCLNLWEAAVAGAELITDTKQKARPPKAGIAPNQRRRRSELLYFSV